MKTLILLTIVLGTLAVQETSLKYHQQLINFKSQGSLFSDEVITLLESSNLLKAVVGLTQLTGGSQAVDFGTLFTALDELKASIQVQQPYLQHIQERRDEENTLFQSDKDQYLTDQSFYANQVTQYKNEAAQHKIDLDTLNNDRTSYETALTQKNKELVETRGLENELQSTIVKAGEVYKTQLNDYNDAISVIDQVIQLLEQVREDSLFIETNGDLYVETTQKIGQKLQALKNERIFYQPLIHSLIQMAENKFADQQLLQKVLGLLRSLRTSLAQNRQSLTNQYENDKLANQRILVQYQAKISSINDKVIPQFTEELKVVIGEISAKQGLLNDSNTNLQGAQDNATQTEDGWIRRQASNKQLLDEYGNELQIISQTLIALERGGIRRQ